MPFEPLDKYMVARINRLQQERFDQLVDAFEPPLPTGVPGRLKRIVASAEINTGDSVLDVGTGTGILIPFIRRYRPGFIHACDLSADMLARLKSNYTDVETIHADIRDVNLPDASIDVVFINASYANIADKIGTFSNLARLTKHGGRVIISHPLGKQFIETLKKSAPYPLDNFPSRSAADALFAPYGFQIGLFVDEPALYVLVLKRLNR